MAGSYELQTLGRHQIPYPKDTKPFSEAGERRAATIIENALTGLALGIGDGGYAIWDEGSYTGDFAVGDNSTVTLVQGSFANSLLALINGVYISSTAAHIWSGIPDSGVAYLYATLVETNVWTASAQSSRQTGTFAAVVATDGNTPANSLLLAVATTNGAAISVEATAAAADLDVFSGGKPRFLRGPTRRGTDTVASGTASKAVTILGLTTGGVVQVTKTSAGPAIDYVAKTAHTLTVYLLGPAPVAGVTFDYVVERL